MNNALCHKSIIFRIKHRSVKILTMVLLVNLDRNKWKWIQLIWNIKHIFFSVLAGYVVEVMTVSCLNNCDMLIRYSVNLTSSTVMVKNKLYSYQQISMEVLHDFSTFQPFQSLGTMNLQDIKRCFFVDWL